MALNLLLNLFEGWLLDYTCVMYEASLAYVRLCVRINACIKRDGKELLSF